MARQYANSGPDILLLVTHATCLAEKQEMPIL